MKIEFVIAKDQPAARSSLRFVRAYIGCLRHTEAVSDCAKCNIGFIASRLEEILNAADDEAKLLALPEQRGIRQQEEEGTGDQARGRTGRHLDTTGSTAQTSDS